MKTEGAALGPVCKGYEDSRDTVSYFNASNMSANMGDGSEEYSNTSLAIDYMAWDLLGRVRTNLE